jgi:hypothetical protein
LGVVVSAGWAGSWEREAAFVYCACLMFVPAPPSLPLSLSPSFPTAPRFQVQAAAVRLSTTGPDCPEMGAASCAEEAAQTQPIPIRRPQTKKRAHSLSPKGASPSSVFGASPLPPHPFSFVVSSSVHNHSPTVATPPPSLGAGASKSAGLGARLGRVVNVGPDAGARATATDEASRSDSAFRRPNAGSPRNVGQDCQPEADGNGRVEARGLEEPLLRGPTTRG